MSIKAMKQALEALDLAFEKDLTYLSDHAMIARQDVVRSRLAITALRVAIAEASMQRLTDVQQEMEQEPVAWMCRDEDLMRRGYSKFSSERSGYWDIPVFTHPPRREWVGLTDEEITACKRTEKRYLSSQEFARAIEAKLKERNT